MNVCTIYIYTYVCRLIVAEISVQIDKNEAIQEIAVYFRNNNFGNGILLFPK